MAYATDDDLHKEFEEIDQSLERDEPEVTAKLLQKCLVMCQLHQLNANELAAKWDSYKYRANAARANAVTQVTVEHLSKLNDDIEAEKLSNKRKEKKIIDVVKKSLTPARGGPMYTMDTLDQLTGNLRNEHNSQLSAALQDIADMKTPVKPRNNKRTRDDGPSSSLMEDDANMLAPSPSPFTPASTASSTPGSAHAFDLSSPFDFSVSSPSPFSTPAPSRRDDLLLTPSIRASPHGSTSKYALRANSGVTVATFNRNLDALPTTAPPHIDYSIEQMHDFELLSKAESLNALGEHVPFRYMWQERDVDTKREAIDRQIREFMSQLKQCGSLAAAAVSSSSSASSAVPPTPNTTSPGQVPALEMATPQKARPVDQTTGDVTMADGLAPTAPGSPKSPPAKEAPVKSEPTPGGPPSPPDNNALVPKDVKVGADAEDVVEETTDGDLDFTSLAVPTQRSVYVCGRICVDEDGARSSSLMLEGDKELSGGYRARIYLNLKSYSLFPGQIVGLRASSNTGHELVVDRILKDPVLPHHALPWSTMKDINSRLSSRGRPVSLMIAAGPFTLNEDLNYSPLFDLLQRVQLARPDYLLLIGPFVDIEHKEVNHGQMTESFEEKFLSVLSDVITQLAIVHTRVLLMPSTRDAHHDSVFPQPAFNIDLDVLPPAATSSLDKLILLPNPTVFRLNDLVFAATSVDPLVSLGKTEILRSGMDGSEESKQARIERFASFLVRQHSFYPMFPPMEKDNVDYSHFDKLLLPVTPDVLILPTITKPQAEDIGNGVLLVNPRYLTMGNAGGTYATIAVHPLKGAQLDVIDQQPVGVAPNTTQSVQYPSLNRLRADITYV